MDGRANACRLSHQSDRRGVRYYWATSRTLGTLLVTVRPISRHSAKTTVTIATAGGKTGVTVAFGSKTEARCKKGVISMATLPSDVFAVIPAYNEALTIADVVRGVGEYISPEQITVVDDQSSDGTPGFALAMGCRVLRTSGPRGYGSAVSTGIDYALQHGSCAVITIDGDAAHDPRDIPRLYRSHAEAGNDLTIGNRFAFEDQKIPSPKRWANVVAAEIVRTILGVTLQDVACGLRVLSGTLSRALALAGVGTGFEHVYDTIAVASAARMSIGSVAIVVRYDATELQCTSAGEVAHFVHSMLRWSSGAHEARLQQLSTMISRLEPLTLLFDEHAICGIPVHEAASYVFQGQHPAFFGRSIGTVLDFRSAVIA